MFSIVIPLYNKEALILDCINSVLLQTFQPCEIIVVDDGSTDLGPDLVLSLNNDRVRLISQENKGVSSARNNGLMLASNDFVCFLDADDTWLPSHLATLRHLILSFPTSHFYATGYIYVDPNYGPYKAPLPYGTSFVGQVFFLHAFIRGSGVISSSSACVRRSSAILAGAFPTHEDTGEDIHLWLRLGFLGPLAYDSSIHVKINHTRSFSSYNYRLQKLPCFLALISSLIQNKAYASYRKSLSIALVKYSLIYCLLAVQFYRKTLLCQIAANVGLVNQLLSLPFYLFLILPAFIPRFLFFTVYRFRSLK